MLVYHLFYSLPELLLILRLVIFEFLSFAIWIIPQPKFAKVHIGEGPGPTGTFLMLQSFVCKFVFLESMWFSSYEVFPKQSYSSSPLAEKDYFLQMRLVSMIMSLLALLFLFLGIKPGTRVPLPASISTLFLLLHIRY